MENLQIIALFVPSNRISFMDEGQLFDQVRFLVVGIENTTPYDLQAIKGIRDKVQLATKFGNVFKNGAWIVQGDPAYVRAACEGSLKRLDVDYIDLYYQHRVDAKVPIEITVSACAPDVFITETIAEICRLFGFGSTLEKNLFHAQSNVQRTVLSDF